jgi:histidyl-tRNA synthetase
MTGQQQPDGHVEVAADLRSPGMRDLGPGEMRRFRAVEARFLEVAARAGYSEIRTPTVEPLHLFTGAGTLSPQMLDRVYSFLDWDGWSGERVVLRPDSTLPAVRWHEERADGEAARLCYVQPVYRFVPGGGQREQWQCGVELFGLAAPEGDAELLRLALGLLTALGLHDVRFELSHSGLVRAALGAAGLDAAAQLATYDRMLEGDDATISELIAARPDQAGALRVLFEVDGGGAGYLANLRAALLGAVPEAEAAIAELEAAAHALADAGCAFGVAPASARNFEYYTGVTFRALAGDVECLRGGRYDGLAETIGGRAVTASGFAADLLGLADLVDAAGGAP